MVARIGLFFLMAVATGCSSHVPNPKHIGKECHGDYALALVVDKSGSVLDNQVLESEKRALLEVIPKLKTETTVTLIAFEFAPWMVVNRLKMNKEGKELAIKKMLLLEPNGTTVPLPAIDQAVKLLKYSEQRCKAFIFMSDAKFRFFTSEDEFEYIFRDKKVDSMAVISLLKGGDTVIMKNLADAGGGDFYQVNDLAQTGKLLTDILQGWDLLE